MGPRHDLSFCACNTAWLAPELLVSMGPNPYLWFLHAKQRLLEQNYKYLCVPALICGFYIHNSAFWTRISSLYGPRLHLWFWAHITACLTQEYKDYMCSSPRLWFCACKTATLAHELLVSMGPSPHLCFLLAKQRLLEQNYKSVWDPDLICRFVHANLHD